MNKVNYFSLFLLSIWKYFLFFYLPKTIHCFEFSTVINLRILLDVYFSLGHFVSFRRKTRCNSLQDRIWPQLVKRKSASGYAFKFFDCNVSWLLHKQQKVSLSSTAAHTTCETIWLRGLMKNFDCKLKWHTKIYKDNQIYISVSKHKRLKHIDVKYNFFQDVIVNGIMELECIPPTGSCIACRKSNHVTTLALYNQFQFLMNDAIMDIVGQVLIFEGFTII